MVAWVVRMMRGLRIFCLIAFGSIGCSSYTEACTLIGCSSGLTVMLDGSPPGPWTIQVQAGGTTMAKDCPAGGNCGGLMFFENFVPTTVSVTVTRGAFSVTYTNLTPTPKVVQPNGARCGPTCQQPFVVVQAP